MKIAFTADVHLRTMAEYPERYNAFENILKQLLESGIEQLFVAGDLFDKETNNYSEFDKMIGKQEYKNLRITVIPGNHDVGIRKEFFSSGNLTIFDKPEIVNFMNGFSIFFLPYTPDKTMGEMISMYMERLPPKWILVSHGDYLTSTFRESNNYEPGTYMPLTAADIEIYKPRKVLLGHIHKKMDAGSVHYVGSPCGLDITETGKRSFIIVDIGEEITKEEREVDTEIINFNERLLVLPSENEIERISAAINQMINGWGLQEGEKNKARIRLRLSGFCLDKNSISSTVSDCLKDYNYNLDDGNLSVLKDIEMVQLAQRVLERIEILEFSSDYPVNKSEITEESLKFIFS